MRILWLICFILLITNRTLAQHYSLFNTNTVYDAFENSARLTFTTDSSRRIAFNFLIPNGGGNGAINGPGTVVANQWLATRKFSIDSLDFSDKRPTKGLVSQNTYLFTLKFYHSVKYKRELGLSWQIRSDGNIELTNQTLALLHTYSNLSSYPKILLPDNPFRTKLQAQSYHQISFTWRENRNKLLAYGIKVSYLSGIGYARTRIYNSEYNTDDPSNIYALVSGDIRTTFRDSIKNSYFYPGLKNPGIAISAGIDYKLKQGWSVSLNIKDIGFIRWNHDAYKFADSNYRITHNMVRNNLWANSIQNNLKEEKFIAPINGKIDALINKDLGFYHPSILLSKNIFYPGFNGVFINRFTHQNINLSLTAAYTSNNIVQIGTQFLIKSSNTEFFVGSDQLFKTINAAKTTINRDASLSKGSTGSSFYLGFALKFGRIMSRWQNDNYIPGINLSTQKKKKSVFDKIFGPRDGSAKNNYSFK